MARTMAYVESGYVPAGLDVKGCGDCGSLADLMNDGKPYLSPLVDEAPWFESGNPDTWDFAGVMPLEVTGLNGSTRTATVTEMVSDGGSVSGVRYASRTIAVTALLLGKTTCAVEAGLSWLSTVLGGSKCSGPPSQAAKSACGGDELCVLTCCPEEFADSPVPGQSAQTPIPTYNWSATGGFFDGVTGEMQPNTTPPGTWTNLVRNPSFEADTFIHWGYAPQPSLALSTDEWPSRRGAQSAKITGDLDGGMRTTLEGEPPVGQVVNVGVAVGSANEQVGVVVSVENAQAAPVTRFLALNTHSYGRVTLSVPVTQAINDTLNPITVRITPRSVNNGTPTATQVLYVDQVIATVESAARTVGYFDGDTNDVPGTTYAWTGAPNGSSSTRTTVAQTVAITGQVIQCIDDAVLDFGVSTVRGPVRVRALALDADGVTVLWTGPWVTVSGTTPAVTIVAEEEWGDWIPRLEVDPAQANDFDIAPVLTHALYRTAAECADQITRSFLDVTTVSGPTVVQTYETDCGERFYKVEWTMVAGNPLGLGPVEPFVTMMSSATGQGAAPHTSEFQTAYQVVTGAVPGSVNDSDTRCPTPVASAALSVVDPCCPGYLAPPALPFIEDTCFTRPTTYRRTWVQVPKDYAPEIEDGLLSVEVLNDNQSKRGLRIRVYPDPIGVGYAGHEECDFCDEFFITYIPPNATWRLDGPMKRVTTQPSGGTQQVVSSASVRGRDGGPFDFPALQCNSGAVVVVDVPSTYPETCGVDCEGNPQGDVWVSVSMRRAAA